jgi:hypothetical protein
MKIIEKSAFIIIICILGIENVFAVPHPPSPTGKKPPPPPGLPIDEGVYLMLIMAVFLGIYIIYNHNLKNN